MTFRYDPVTKQRFYKPLNMKQGKHYFIRKCLVCGTRFLTDASHIHYCSNQCYRQDNKYLGYKEVNIKNHILQPLSNNDERVYTVYARDEVEAKERFNDKQALFFNDPSIISIVKTEKDLTPFYKYRIYWRKS